MRFICRLARCSFSGSGIRKRRYISREPFGSRISYKLTKKSILLNSGNDMNM